MKNLLVLIILFLFFPAFSFSQTGEETAGKAAEQAGKLREAFTHYMAAVQSVSEGSADDQRLKETIIKLVQKLSPPPAVPEESTRFSVRGQIAIKEAKSAADFDEAAREFGNALRVAPWWADGYINQGVALEKAGKFNEAARALKFYLLADPNAPDVKNVKNQIYALEYRQEKAQKEAQSTKAEAERKAEQQRVARQREEDAKNARTASAENLNGTYVVERNNARYRFIIGVSGQEITISTGMNFSYRGNVEGSSITGTYTIDNSHIGGRIFRSPFTGTISVDRSTITLYHTTELETGDQYSDTWELRRSKQ